MTKQALISVSDKRGIEDFARGLAALGFRLLSTGGTAKLLAAAGLDVTEVAQYTGFPEILDGRVKTLNPRIHAGLLARRDDEAHVRALAEHAIDPIDILVVNLYPFEQTVARPVALSTMRSRTSTSAGRPCCARRRRITPAWCRSSSLSDYMRACWPNCAPMATSACSHALQRWRKRRSLTPHATTARLPTI
jgi:hypothetical protein